MPLPLTAQLEKCGLHWVGDLARCSPHTLIHDHKIPVGRMDQIRRALLALCMTLGERLPAWQRKHLGELREFFATEIRELSSARNVVRKTSYDTKRFKNGLWERLTLRMNSSGWLAGLAQGGLRRREYATSVGMENAELLWNKRRRKSV